MSITYRGFTLRRVGFGDKCLLYFGNGRLFAMSHNISHGQALIDEWIAERT